jgi:hypothetical protein
MTAVVKWIFTDYWQTGPTPYTYTMEVNPNTGGALQYSKTVNIAMTSGPSRVGIAQEGGNSSGSGSSNSVAVLSFSGVILTQTQLEAMEHWFDKRILMQITDDLGRQYFGVFSQFNPQRQRKASNFWYHTYDAQMTVVAYKNASGAWVYGRVG